MNSIPSTSTEYTPYGIQATSYEDYRHSYTGREFDETSKTYYYRSRYYAPQSGRFNRLDDIRSGENWVTYVNNDPINYVDPFGFEGERYELLEKQDIVNRTQNPYVLIDIPIISLGTGISQWEILGDNFARLSFGANIVGIGFVAGAGATANPSLLAGSEFCGLTASILDGLAFGCYGVATIEYAFESTNITDISRARTKAIVSGGSIVLNICLNASISYKHAFHGSRFFVQSTGRYAPNSLKTLYGAGREYMFGAGYSKITEIIQQVIDGNTPQTTNASFGVLNE